MLPHDWLTWRLRGCPESGATTDRGDASGTGYWSAATGDYRSDLLELAAGRSLTVPQVVAPDAVVGEVADGALPQLPAGVRLAAGTGDNMAAALGLGMGPGDVAVSLGTSGTVFAVSETPCADSRGYVAGFADATGRFLPLVCTLNAARVLDAAAGLLGVDHEGLSALALAAPSGADGLVLIPYLDGERTPDLPASTGSLHGITRANLRPETMARAAVEGMLCGLADGLDALRETGVTPRRVLLIGGATSSPSVTTIAAELFDSPVEVPAPAEYVALGAARQAAWALTGSLPRWEVPTTPVPPATYAHSTRENYARAWQEMYGQ